MGECGLVLTDFVVSDSRSVDNYVRIEYFKIRAHCNFISNVALVKRIEEPGCRGRSSHPY
jgi:hypothetical protein